MKTSIILVALSVLLTAFQNCGRHVYQADLESVTGARRASFDDPGFTAGAGYLAPFATDEAWVVANLHRSRNSLDVYTGQMTAVPRKFPLWGIAGRLREAYDLHKETRNPAVLGLLLAELERPLPPSGSPTSTLAVNRWLISCTTC